MNKYEEWLEKRISGKPLLDRDEQMFIDLLMDRSAHKNEISGAIDILEMLLSLDALPNLILLLKDETRDYALRESAARAVAGIGSSYVQGKLDALRPTASPSLTHLLDLAQ